VTVLSSKENELQRLLKQGYEEHELTWVPAGTDLTMALYYVHGEDPERRLSLLDSGQWIISQAGVERIIRKMPGCENYSIEDALTALKNSPFLRQTTLHRKGKTSP
jgi:hypothetical protein